jgi:hypothetical protein
MTEERKRRKSNRPKGYDLKVEVVEDEEAATKVIRYLLEMPNPTEGREQEGEGGQSAHPE